MARFYNNSPYIMLNKIWIFSMTLFIAVVCCCNPSCRVDGGFHSKECKEKIDKVACIIVLRRSSLDSSYVECLMSCYMMCPSFKKTPPLQNIGYKLCENMHQRILKILIFFGQGAHKYCQRWKYCKNDELARYKRLNIKIQPFLTLSNNNSMLM